MQRKLTLQIARQAGLPILSMEHHDCLLFGGGDLVKMFVPRAKRVMGGSPQDRMVTGHLLIVPKDNLQPLTPPIAPAADHRSVQKHPPRELSVDHPAIANPG